MATIKTAISIEKSLLQEVDHLSQKLKISRSQFFCLAARQLTKTEETKALLQAINNAHDDPITREEKAWLNQVKQYHGKVLKKEKW